MGETLVAGYNPVSGVASTFFVDDQGRLAPAGIGDSAKYHVLVKSAVTLSSVVQGVKFVFMPGGSLILSSGTTLRDCTLDLTQLGAVGNYPTAFISIQGDDILIEGNTAVATYPFVIDSSGVGRILQFDSNASRVKITKNTFKYGYYAIYADGKTLTDCSIVDNELLGLRYDIWLDDIAGSNLRIDQNHFPAKPWTSPQTNQGEVFVVAGGNYYTAGWLTNTVYNNNFFLGLSVSGNIIDRTAHRAIYVVNIVGAAVNSNVINAQALAEDNTGPNQSDDVLCLELVRSFTCNGNIIHASGENGIDILGCKSGTVLGNTVRQCDATALMFDISDVVRAGYAGTFDAVNHLNENIEAAGNYLEGGNSAQEIRCGRSLRLSNRIGKFWTGRAVSNRYDLSLTVNTTYISKANGTWPDDIDASGCTKVRRESVLCNADFSSNTIRTNYEHGFLSGDRVNLFCENSATGALPTSLDDITDYYVVRLSATTFKLATSFANATAASPTTITFGSTATGNVYVSELQAGRLYLATDPGFDVRGLKVSRDLAEVSVLTSVAANTNYITTFGMIKGVRDLANFRFAWLVRNAVTDFGSASNLSTPRYFEFLPGSVYDSAGAAARRGVDIQWHDRTQVKWRTGDYLLPSPGTDPAGTPGLAYNDRSSGYLRSIVM